VSLEDEAAAAWRGSSLCFGYRFGSAEQEVLSMQGVERYVLERRDDVRPIRYDNVGSRLRDVTVCDRFVKLVFLFPLFGNQISSGAAVSQ
jgi:hypothetical protein